MSLAKMFCKLRCRPNPFMNVLVRMILPYIDDGAMNDEPGTDDPGWPIGTLLGRTYISRLSTH